MAIERFRDFSLSLNLTFMYSVYFGIEQECNTVYENKCETKYEQECNTKYEKECTTVPSKVNQSLIYM